MRITDEWGILEVTRGALLAPDWKQVTVAAPPDPVWPKNSSPVALEQELIAQRHSKILGGLWQGRLPASFIYTLIYAICAASRKRQLARKMQNVRGDSSAILLIVEDASITPMPSEPEIPFFKDIASDLV